MSLRECVRDSRDCTLHSKKRTFSTSSMSRPGQTTNGRRGGAICRTLHRDSFNKPITDLLSREKTWMTKKNLSVIREELALK